MNCGLSFIYDYNGEVVSPARRGIPTSGGMLTAGHWFKSARERRPAFCSWQRCSMMHCTSLLLTTCIEPHGCSARLRGGAFCVLTNYWGICWPRVRVRVRTGLYFWLRRIFLPHAHLVFTSFASRCERECLDLRPLGGPGWHWMLLCWLRWRWRWGGGGNG